MKKKLREVFWYARNLLNLLIAAVRIFFYFLRKPKKVSKLLFSLFSTINEFYQYSHGRLYSFETTRTFGKIKKDLIFAKCNFFNTDPSIARPVETQVISSLADYLKPKNIFEIGTYNGFTTLHLACNSPQDSMVYTLDLCADFGKEAGGDKKLEGYSYDDVLVVELSMKNRNNRIFHNHPCRKKIVELFGDSLSFDFSSYHKKMDLIFIDGGHSYKHVRSDTQNAFRMLSDNGVIIWHDFDYIIHRDVFKYLNQLVKTHRIYSIPNTRFAIYGPAL